MRLHHNWLVAFVARLENDRSAIDDIVGDVWLVAVRHADWLEAQDTALCFAWLTGVARNVLRHRARSVGRQRDLKDRLGSKSPGTFFEWHDDDPASAVEHREQVARVRAALWELTPQQRELLGRAAEGASGEELAAWLDASLGATRQRLSRARQQLRALLDEGELGGHTHD